MPRPPKTRWIEGHPPVLMFKPAGVPARTLQRVTLRLDEYEALRLADYEGLEQDEVAERLGVSRPTVSRILERAHKAVADMLVEGRALVVEGGPVQLGVPDGRGRGRHGHGHGGPQGSEWNDKEGVAMGGGTGRGEGKGRARGRGRMGGVAAGPGGDCVCPSCGHKTPHQRGVPCVQAKCPECGTNMVREG